MLPGADATLIGVAALIVVMVPFLWPLVEHFNVMAHEGAHALVGSTLAHGVNAGDAHNLSSTTPIPRRIWALLWLAGTLLAVVIGGKWMILRT